MKKLLFIILSMAVSFALNGQNIKKIVKFYEKGEYQKTIEKAKQYSRKYPQDAYPYYYTSLSYFQLYKTGKPLKKKYFMQQSVNYVVKGLNRDTSKEIFREFVQDFNQMHDSLKSLALSLYYSDKKSQSEFFLKNLAVIFQDTTEEYREILEARKPKPQIFEQNLAFKEYEGEINQTDEQGRKQGVWIEKYDNGVVKSEIYYKDGHPAGVFRLYYPNGRLKADLYFDSSGKRCSAILYKDDGSKFAMGYYYDKKKDSLWQYFYNDTIVISEENWKKGVKNGAEYVYSIYYYPNLLEEKYWKNGKLDSIYIRYYPWGRPKFMAFYKDGKRTGPTNVFDENGKLIIKGFYKNDLSDSVWVFWNDDKNKYDTLVYKDGKLLPEYEEKEAEILRQQIQNHIENPENQFFIKQENDQEY